jgi:hypothetical protein
MKPRVSVPLCAFALVLPFVMFWWLMPFVASLTFGTDYPCYTLEPQMELMFGLWTGTWPLYVPGFSGGLTASGLTLSQIYHPISYLSSFMPGYWTGQALEWHTFWRLASLGGMHLILLLFLRRLGVLPLFAFLLSFITLYNQRMSNLFGLGASLENYTAHMLLCVAVCWHAIQPTRRFGPLVMVAATYLLVTGGHPQMAFLGFLGVGLYTLLAPFILPCFVPESRMDAARLLRFYVEVSVCILVGVLLSSAYLFPFYSEYIRGNASRVGQSYLWGAGYPDTLYGVLCNFFMPLRSDLVSAFGGSVLILPALLLPLVLFVKDRIHRSSLLLWVLLIFILFVMLGKLTPVHYILWKLVPFYSSFRGPGRISMILPFLLMLLMAALIRQERVPVRIGRLRLAVHPAAFLALVSLPLYALYHAVPTYGLVIWTKDGAGWTSPDRFNADIIPGMVRHLLFCCGMLSLVALAAWGITSRRCQQASGILLAVAVLAQVAVTLRYGSFVLEKPRIPTWESQQTQKREYLAYGYYTGDGLDSADVQWHVNHTFLEPRLARISHEIIPVHSRETAYAQLAGMDRTPGTAVVENPPPESVQISASLTTSSIQGAQDAVTLSYASFNRVVFEAHNPLPGFFLLSFPFTSYWRAWLDGAEAPIFRVNGLEQGVWIRDAGTHAVEFRYHSPASVWGFAVSCATGLLAGLYFAAGVGPRLSRHALCAFLLLAFPSLFVVWRHSWYTGDNLGTQYVWRTPPAEPLNVAYGKKTQMSSQYPFLERDFSESRGVDGVSGKDSHFSTWIEPQPWWTMDLARIRPISRLVICNQSGFREYLERNRNHAILQLDKIRGRFGGPFEVLVSTDGQNYETVQTIHPAADGQEWEITLNGKPVRYIRLRLLGEGALAISEIKAFEQKNAVRGPAVLRPSSSCSENIRKKRTSRRGAETRREE